jgi:hypothetical protein
MFVGVVSPQETEFVISNHEIHEGMCVNFAISTGMKFVGFLQAPGREFAPHLKHIGPGRCCHRPTGFFRVWWSGKSQVESSNRHGSTVSMVGFK